MSAPMNFIPLHDPLWQPLNGDEAPRTHALLSLAQWQALRGHWPPTLPVGVTLANTDDVAMLGPDMARLALVVLQFPKWTDGRAYSQARLLRGRLRYAGELRAGGDVVVDMLPLLQRSGFDAVQLRAGQSERNARQALGIFGGYYQADMRRPAPPFGRQGAVA